MTAHNTNSAMIDPIPSAVECEMKDQTEKATPIQVFYNSECPVCNAEIEHYKKLDKRAGAVDFARIIDDPEALKAYGLTKADIERRLYAFDRKGTLVSGTDAFIAIWREIPAYRWLANVTALPGIYQIANVLYDHVAVPLLASWNAWRVKKRR